MGIHENEELEAAFVLHARGYRIDSAVLGRLRAVGRDPVHLDRLVRSAHAPRQELEQFAEAGDDQEKGTRPKIERKQDGDQQ